MTSKDVLLVALSDMHSGSQAALFPDRVIRWKNGGNHDPRLNWRHVAIGERWKKSIEEIAAERNGRRVILVNDGDAVEGLHHNNEDVVTRDVDEQCDIHIELMKQFMSGIKWQRGDTLYYVRGTQTHTTEKEHEIAKELGAVQFGSGDYIADHLELEINGRVAWFVHEGPGSGKGANEGNGLRNWLRDIYFDALKDGKTPPDATYSGHVHKHNYQIYIAKHKGQPSLVHGHILPSWQMKTRYAYRVASTETNTIGCLMQVYTASGDIRVPYFSIEQIGSATRG